MSNKDAPISVFDTNETVTVVKIRNAMFSSVLSSFSLSNKEKERKGREKNLQTVSSAECYRTWRDKCSISESIKALER